MVLHSSFDEGNVYFFEAQPNIKYQLIIKVIYIANSYRSRALYFELINCRNIPLDNCDNEHTVYSGNFLLNLLQILKTKEIYRRNRITRVMCGGLRDIQSVRSIPMMTRIYRHQPADYT